MSGPPDQPRASAPQMWRRTYNILERQLGGPLTEFVHSDVFADGLGIATRTRSIALRLVERGTRRYWHRLNLPAGSDITRVQEQLAALQREIAALSARLPADRPAPPSDAH
jgi:hypothetical protein